MKLFIIMLVFSMSFPLMGQNEITATAHYHMETTYELVPYNFPDGMTGYGYQIHNSCRGVSFLEHIRPTNTSSPQIGPSEMEMHMSRKSAFDIPDSAGGVYSPTYNVVVPKIKTKNKEKKIKSIAEKGESHIHVYAMIAALLVSLIIIGIIKVKRQGECY